MKLSDVLQMVRPKPKDKDRSELWKRLRKGELKSFDTWEAELSSGKDKKEVFTRLLEEKKLGGLAFLRNLRNMVDAKVDRTLILERLRGDFSRVLPFRFIAAAKYAPSLAQEIGEAMERQLENELVALNGRTVLLVDVSGSMNDKLSAKSEMTRMEAASAMAMLFRARCESVRVLTFSNSLVEVPNYKGMALRDAIVNSQSHSGLV